MNIDDIIDAKKFIENNENITSYSRISYLKAAELMAKYHQSKVKENELLHSVSQQRELLKFFSAQLSENLDIDVGMNYITEEDIEECLKNFNCG